MIHSWCVGAAWAAVKVRGYTLPPMTRLVPLAFAVVVLARAACTRRAGRTGERVVAGGRGLLSPPPGAAPCPAGIRSAPFRGAPDRPQSPQLHRPLPLPLGTLGLPAGDPVAVLRPRPRPRGRPRRAGHHGRRGADPGGASRVRPPCHRRPST